MQATSQATEENEAPSPMSCARESATCMEGRGIVPAEAGWPGMDG